MLIEYYQYLTTIAPFLPVAFGLYAYKGLGKELRILFYFVCFSAVAELVSALISIGGNNTMPGAHVYVLVEFIILTFFYANYIKVYIARKYIWVIIAGFTVLSVLNALFIQKITAYPNILRAVESIVMVIFSVLYFHKIMVEAKIKKLSKEPMIWINTAMLVYFSGNFFFHILFPVVLANSEEFARRIIYFYWSSNILFYLILTVGFYKQIKLAER